MIDPVRFISNFSSGKMGIAVAEAAVSAGAVVTLVLGPVEKKPAKPSVRVINVISADSMAGECLREFDNCDIAILAAAVADYTPLSPSPVKMKRKNQS